MEMIDPADVKEPLTVDQLVRGARGMSYRAQQLAAITMLGEIGADQSWGIQAVRNARVDSALANGRALAYFLTADRKHDDRNLSVTHYSKAAWKKGATKITKVAEKIIDAASAHLAHASAGEEGWEPHPGEWPLSEMAVVLTSGLADFVDALSTQYVGRAAWFYPAPRETVDWLMTSEPLSEPTPKSKHKQIGDLTKSLQRYLDLDAT